MVTRSGILRHSIPVAVANREVAINQDIKGIILRNELHADYVLYLINGSQLQLLSLWKKQGATVESLETDLIKDTTIPLPPLPEQRAIAAFLDRETARIDDLIAKKERLIQLLQEKRAALITHAVTKGIQPDVKMKDSGVEWIGEVPEGWVTPPLYARYSVELGKMLDASRITGKHLLPYLRNIDVQWDKINYNDLPEMDIPMNEHDRFTVRSGDLLICEGGEVGRAAIVADLCEPVGYQKALHRIRACSRNEAPRFLFYTFVWAACTGVFSAGSMSTIAHLTGEQLRRYRFPTPPVSEQNEIVEFLDRETARIDDLIAKIRQAITTLSEYRSALISSAVTGKIDVREDG